MVHAYVAVRTAAGASERIIDALRELPEVREAHIVAGKYDIIAEVTVDDVYSAIQVASSNIQNREGVLDTRTYISLN